MSHRGFRKQILHVTTEDKLSGEDLSDFEADYKVNLDSALRVVLKSAQIPNTFYNIEDATFKYGLSVVGEDYEVNMIRLPFPKYEGNPANSGSLVKSLEFHAKAVDPLFSVTQAIASPMSITYTGALSMQIREVGDYFQWSGLIEDAVAGDTITGDSTPDISLWDIVEDDPKDYPAEINRILASQSRFSVTVEFPVGVFVTHELFVPLPRYSNSTYNNLETLFNAELIAHGSTTTYTTATNTLTNGTRNIKILKAPEWLGFDLQEGASPLVGNNLIEFYPYGSISAEPALPHTLEREIYFIVDPAEVFTHNIPQGYYTTTSLIDHLSTLIVADDATSSIVFSDLNLKITIDNPTKNVVIYETTFNNHVLGYDIPTLIPFGTENVIMSPYKQYLSVLTQSTALSDRLLDLRGVETIFLHCDFVDGNHFLVNERSHGENLLQGDVLDTINVDAPFGSTIYHTNPHSELSSYDFQSPKNISTFRVYLTDQRNNKIMPNLNWSFNLVVYSEL